MNHSGARKNAATTQNRILQVLGGGGVFPCPRVIHSPRVSRLKLTAMKRVLCSIAILLFLFRAAEGGPAYSSAEQKIFEQLNQARQTAGLPPLEWNELVA